MNTIMDQSVSLGDRLTVGPQTFLKTQHFGLFSDTALQIGPGFDRLIPAVCNARLPLSGHGGAA